MSYLLFLLLQPTLIGGSIEIEARGAATELSRDITAGPATFWSGYEVPRVAGAHQGCAGVYRLDDGGGYTTSEKDNNASLITKPYSAKTLSRAIKLALEQPARDGS